MGRYQKYIAILLMFSVYMMPFNARAAGLNGWTLQNPIAKGASVAYDGLKNVIINGKNVVKTSTALITPTSIQVAKVLGKGVAGFALSVAVEQLLGQVDWILDPENNRIIYKKTSKIEDFGFGCYGASSFSSTLQTILNTCNASLGMTDVKLTSKGQETLDKALASMQIGNIKTIEVEVSVARPNDTPAIVTMLISVKKIGEVKDQEKYLPLPTVANQVITNAESEDNAKAIPAQVATTAAAADVVNEAAKDDVKARPIVNQLEANANTKTEADANTANGTQTQNPTKPNTTDLSLEFPTFCGWAPQVCEAAQTVISFPQTLINWWDTANSKADSWVKSVSEAWTAVKDWVKEPEKDITEIDLDNPVQTEPDTKISFSTACPAKIPLTFNWNGQTLDFSFDFSIWCESISTYVFPIVVALGSLHALYIVAGVRQDV